MSRPVPKVHSLFDPPDDPGIEFGTWEDVVDPKSGKPVTDKDGVIQQKFVPEKHLTQQEFKDECDINRIMAQALQKGMIPVTDNLARYGDFSEVGEYQDAQNLRLRAEAQFAALPAKLRDRLQNDPARFLEWIAKPENLDEALEFGLLSDEESKRIINERSKVIEKPAEKT